MEDPKLVKPRELIQLLPNDKLCFQNSEKEDITYLTLLNSTSLKVAYKIKTTSPYDFKVCPSKGIICAYSNVKVRIILLPIPNIHKKRHKFLIQAKYTTYSELSKIE